MHDILQKIDEWFSSIAPISHPPEEGIMNELLNRFGIKSALDIAKFIVSPQGKLMEACINQVMERDISAFKHATLENTLELTKKQHLAYLLLGLRHNKKKAIQHAKTLEQEEQQAQLLQLYQKNISHKHQRRHAPSFEETIAYYENARLSILAEMQWAQQKINLLSQELQLLEQNTALLLIQREMYPKIERLFMNKAVDISYIELQIKGLVDAYDKSVNALQNMTNNPLSEAFIEHWNRMDRYQIEARLWLDLKSNLKTKQSIVERNGVLYLIDGNSSLDTLSFEERKKAAEAYLALKPKLEKTQLSWKDKSQLQEVELFERKNQLQKQVTFEREKTLFLINQLAAVDESLSTFLPLLKRTETEQSGQSHVTLQLKPMPRPSFSRITPPPPSPTPKPLRPLTNNSIQENLLFQLEQCRLLCQQPRQSPQTGLSTSQLCQMANTIRATLIEELKAKPKELIPGTLPSPSFLSMLMTLNKTPLNIEKRLHHISDESLKTAPEYTRKIQPPSPFN